ARRQAPHDRNLLRELIADYDRAEMYREWRDLCEQLITDDQLGTFALFERGRAELRLNWYREARDSFTKAGERDPTYPGVKEHLDPVSGILGQGPSELVRRPIDAVALAPDLLGQAPPLSEASLAGHPACYLDEVHAVSFLAGKELRTTTYLTVKTLTAQG